MSVPSNSRDVDKLDSQQQLQTLINEVANESDIEFDDVENIDQSLVKTSLSDVINICAYSDSACDSDSGGIITKKIVLISDLTADVVNPKCSLSSNESDSSTDIEILNKQNLIAEHKNMSNKKTILQSSSEDSSSDSENELVKKIIKLEKNRSDSSSDSEATIKIKPSVKYLSSKLSNTEISLSSVSDTDSD